MTKNWGPIIRIGWSVVVSHKFEIACLVFGPIAAICVAVLLVAHTNWMTYDSLNVRLWPAVVHAAPGTFVLHGLLLCTLGVVFFNTLAYLISSWNTRQPIVLVSCIVTLIIILLWGAEVYGGFIIQGLEGYNSGLTLDIARHLHDGFATLLFLLFLVMDFVLYRRCRKARANNDCNAMTLERLDEDTYWLQLLMVDFPVVCGVVLANLFLHELLEASEALGSISTRGPFLTGFGAGSLVMQITLSQVVFLSIYVRRLAWKCRLHSEASHSTSAV